jgi:hypothetical protein
MRVRASETTAVRRARQRAQLRRLIHREQHSRPHLSDLDSDGERELTREPLGVVPGVDPVREHGSHSCSPTDTWFARLQAPPPRLTASSCSDCCSHIAKQEGGHRQLRALRALRCDSLWDFLAVRDTVAMARRSSRLSVGSGCSWSSPAASDASPRRVLLPVDRETGARPELWEVSSPQTGR